MIRRFIDYITIERHYSDKTCIAYERDLQDLCAFLNVPPEELDPKRLDTDDIRLWMVDMLEQGQSKRSVCRKLSSVRSFYKYLLKMEIVDVDITQKIIAPKLDKSLPIFFKPSEMAAEERLEKCAETFEDYRDNLIISMLYQTGMRRAELASLQRNDIDLHQGQIRVFGKRRKERVIPIGVNLIEKINEYYTIMQEEKIGPSEHFLIKINKEKESSPLRVEDIYRVVRARMGDVSTLKKHSPHVLRHTFATAMLDNGADIRSIQHLLGHASLATTTIYTHTTFEQIKNQYNKAHPRAIKMKGERKNES